MKIFLKISISSKFPRKLSVSTPPLRIFLLSIIFPEMSLYLSMNFLLKFLEISSKSWNFLKKFLEIFHNLFKILAEYI